MNIRKILVVGSLASAAFVSACKTNLLSGQDLPAVNQQPAAPAAPVVVEGMRTSYADVVDRTSPAVVRIVADHN
jgi:hypothetical protein